MTENKKAQGKVQERELIGTWVLLLLVALLVFEKVLELP
jgi:hypothetical protein